MLTDEDLRATDREQLDDLRALATAYAARAPVRRVAVVGNAPLAADPARARAIDDCDLVVRCNSFVLDEGDRPEQAFCGRATHVVVFNGGTRITRSVLAGYPGRLYLRSAQGAVYRRRPTRPLPAVDLWPDDTGAGFVPNRAVVAGLREEVRAVDPSGDPVVVPTTGLVAVWLARQLFPDAAMLLTGFTAFGRPAEGEGDAGDRVTSWRHHGREDADPVPVSVAHKVDAEGELLRRWVTQGRAEHRP